MIIVEGPDGAGKTTLVGKISKHFDVEIATATKGRNKESYRTPEAIRDRTYKALRKEIKHHDPFVYDRFFFSELIYGEILRGHTIFNNPESSFICRLMLAYRVPVIFCLPPLEVLHHTIYGHDQMEGVTENIDKIYNGYSVWYELAKDVGSKTETRTTVPYIYRYNFTDERSLPKVYRRIEEYLVDRKLRMPWL